MESGAIAMSDLTHTAKPKAAPLLMSKSKAPAVVHHATASGGHALDAKTQQTMAGRFGHDFSKVRIHTDTRAAQSAQALGANAYAVGGDIIFGERRYAPGSREGDRLLAHELTHVVQQGRHGVGDWEQSSNPGDASEQEADRAANQALSGDCVKVTAMPGAAIARSMPPIPGPPGLPTGNMGAYDALLEQAAQEAAASSQAATLGTAATAPIDAAALGTAATVPVDAVALGTAATVPVEAAGAAGLGAEAAGAGGAAGLGAGAILPLLAAGAVGAGTGYMLANHTEVGPDTVGAIGGIDNMLTGKGERSAMLRLDEYRQDQWDKGGLGGVGLSALAGVGEGVVGLGGAVGGLAEGAYHGLGAIGSGIAGLFD